MQHDQRVHQRKADGRGGEDEAPVHPQGPPAGRLLPRRDNTTSRCRACARTGTLHPRNRPSLSEEGRPWRDWRRNDAAWQRRRDPPAAGPHLDDASPSRGGTPASTSRRRSAAASRWRPAPSAAALPPPPQPPCSPARPALQRGGRDVTVPVPEAQRMGCRRRPRQGGQPAERPRAAVPPATASAPEGKTLGAEGTCGTPRRLHEPPVRIERTTCSLQVSCATTAPRRQGLMQSHPGLRGGLVLRLLLPHSARRRTRAGDSADHPRNAGSVASRRGDGARARDAGTATLRPADALLEAPGPAGAAGQTRGPQPALRLAVQDRRFPTTSRKQHAATCHKMPQLADLPPRRTPSRKTPLTRNRRSRGVDLRLRVEQAGPEMLPCKR